MKLHTFIIIPGDSDYVTEEVDLTDDQRERLRYTEDCFGFRVIKCIHPKLEDNIVKLLARDGDEFEFIRDHNGYLWYYQDSLSREDAIKIFE